MTGKTVIQHVLSRLHDIGITDIFGVPGDYAFPVNDAICEHPEIKWIGCSNELNAAYAADGYARIRGVAALSTTYGVGELSAINGIAGSYAEHLPVFHLVGTPGIGIQSGRAIMHHTLGNGEYDLFQRMSVPVTCAQAVMTPQNAAFETERLIFEALYHRRPVYMAFPADYANLPVIGQAEPIPAPRSDPKNLAEATRLIAEALDKASAACFLPGYLLNRLQRQDLMQKVVEASNLPFATMFMGKSILDEQHPNYIGIYDGKLMNADLRQYVETCDCVVKAGTLMSDFNSGAFTASLDAKKTITIDHHHTVIFGKVYAGVELSDLLSDLIPLLKKHELPMPLQPFSYKPIVGSEKEKISVDTLYPRWSAFLKPGDILIAETGTASMGLGFAHLPKAASFHNQTLYGSIGWATPAAFGAAIAAPDKRVVLVTGDGSHQLTAQEIGQFGRHGLKPVIFILNNSGYLIERLLCKNPAIYYNDIAPWNYSELPHALGLDHWFSCRVTTCGEMDAALTHAFAADHGCYIEVVTDKYAASPLSVRLHENMSSLYGK